MDKLRLLRRVYTIKLWKELFLMLQIFFLVIFFQASFYPFEKIAQFSRDMKDCFMINTKTILHFDPYAGIQENGSFERQSQNEEFQEKIEACQEYVKKTGMVAELRADVLKNGEHTSVANLIVYSNDLNEMTNLPLKEGVFTSQTEEMREASCVPVVIAGTLADKYQIGDHIDISTTFDGENKQNIDVLVTGILNEEKPVITIHYGGTTKQLDTIGFYPTNMTGYSFLFAVENESFGQMKWNYPLLFETKSNDMTKETAQKLSEILSEYGTIDSYRYLEQRSWYWAAFEHQWEILLCILFIPILVFGFGGYLFIHLMQNRERMAIFYLIGMSKKSLFLFYSAAAEIIILIPIVVATFLTEPIIKNIYQTAKVRLRLTNVFFFVLVFSGIAFVVNGSILLRKSGTQITMICKEGNE